MVGVVGVRFTPNGKIYDFSPSSLDIPEGAMLVVETARGLDLGQCVVPLHEVEEGRVVAPLRPVIRVATPEDIARNEAQLARRDDVLQQAQGCIGQHGLDMKLVDVEFTFEGKIIFFFTAEGRVDFRDLVRDLATMFRTRIELRQIGVRDEAKMLGGMGPCGRAICCRQFLPDFQPVSIKMAKEQNLSLNPTKISGLCGRLMCCLKYEQDAYEAVRKMSPKPGREVVTPDGPGLVHEINALKETVRVRFVTPDQSIEIREYSLSSLRPAGSAPAPHEGEAPVVRKEGGPRSDGRPQRAPQGEISKADVDRANALRAIADEAPSARAAATRQGGDGEEGGRPPMEVLRPDRHSSRWRGNTDDSADGEEAEEPTPPPKPREAADARRVERRDRPQQPRRFPENRPATGAAPAPAQGGGEGQRSRPAGAAGAVGAKDERRMNRDARPVRPLTGNRDERRAVPSLRDMQPPKDVRRDARPGEQQNAGDRPRPPRPPQPKLPRPQQHPVQPPRPAPQQPLADPSSSSDLSPDTFGARDTNEPPRKPRRHHRGGRGRGGRPPQENGGATQGTEE